MILRPPLRLLSTLALLPTLASAASTPAPAFDLERLSLNPTSRAALGTSAGGLREPGELRLSLAAHHERSPLTLYRDGERRESLIGSRTQVQLAGTYTVSKRVEVGAILPLMAHQGTSGFSNVGMTSPESWGLGTPVLQGRLGLLDEASAPVSLAAELAVGLPVGNKDALQGSGGWDVTPRVAAGRTVGPVVLGLEAGVRLRNRTAVGSREVGSELPWAATVATTGHKLRGELGLRSAVPLTDSPVPLELLAGGRYALGSRMEVFALGGPGLGTAPGTPAFRVMAGLSVAALQVDRPVMRPRVAEAPAPEPEPVAPPVAVVDVCAPNQSHSLEQCPNLDDDSDGVANAKDHCPVDPEDRDGFLDEDGCPEVDNDGDAVADVVDNCPLESGPASNQGCPAKQKQLVVITQDRLEIREKVYFASGKAQVLPRSFPLLEQVAKVLENHPELTAILVEGHTDSRGRPETNRTLSQQRAAAVIQKLESLGVATARLMAAGRGPDAPVASNTTASGRELNRRVEFHIVPHD
ncbi:OmpA family protein [Corallococcus aberystwythensis]|uniref:OmpA family protein n=1 Tax=Corallococcus aberystwythensis TaxID=2316722 RepID=A0A3A8R0G0_9BACT|nr:OmpA family protein [Corallococcus aberystwythensis]RKH74343.1 OmpA family protein [Corallococcus aberystwythensis]